MFKVNVSACLSNNKKTCCLHAYVWQNKCFPTHKTLHISTTGLKLHREALTVTATITRGPCWALGHVRSYSVSHRMSHSAHSVTSLDLSGKQDVRKANSDERAILGMKMKKELENMLLFPPNLKFSTTCSAFLLFNGSFWTSDES